MATNYNKPMTTFKNRTCALCGYKTTYRDEVPERCRNCGHPYDKPVTVKTFGSEKAKPTTHRQYRVYCRACNEKSIVWQGKKKIGRPVCPHCGEAQKLNVSSIKDSGDCVSNELWSGSLSTGPNMVPRIRPKKKFVVCGNCGRKMGYLLKKPEQCNRCNEPFS